MPAATSNSPSYTLPAMKLAITTIILCTLASCTTTEPQPTSTAVHTWGTIREALRDGKTEARVDLADAVTPTMVAVGAVAGLDGEISIIDGTCYVSRSRGGTLETLRSPDLSATILFAAEVPEWQTLDITEKVDSTQIATFVASSAQSIGIDTREAFPFVIEGDLLRLQVHVLAGECPIRAQMLGEEMTSPPFRKRLDRVHGKLIGIHASQGGGVITHHGSPTHVHALITGKNSFTGHVDTVSIAAGAVLRLPKR